MTGFVVFAYFTSHTVRDAQASIAGLSCTANHLKLVAEAIGNCGCFLLVRTSFARECHADPRQIAPVRHPYLVVLRQLALGQNFVCSFMISHVWMQFRYCQVLLVHHFYHLMLLLQYRFELRSRFCDHGLVSSGQMRSPNHRIEHVVIGYLVHQKCNALSMRGWDS